MNVDIFRHINFENRSMYGGEMQNTLLAQNLCNQCAAQICDKNCVKSIPKQNRMKNMSLGDHFYLVKVIFMK